MSYRCTLDKVIVQVDPDEYVTPAGLLIGHADIERPTVLTGTVLAAGEGRIIAKGKRRGQLVPLEVKKGDRVVFTRNVGWPLQERPEVIALREDMIQGVVEE